MKPLLHFSFLLLAALLVFPNTVNAQSFDKAVDYLDFVSGEQEVLTKKMWEYTKAIAHSRNDKNIAAKKKSLLKSMERAIIKIEKAETFENDIYKNQVLENLKLNKSLLEEEYEEIIDMKAVAENSYDLMEAYFMARELADEKMTQAQQEYEIHFYDYAKRHDIDIIESETDLGKKMKISGEVFDHYNDMYLCFFKVSINEAYLFEAIENDDVAAIEQSASSLSSAAKEGLEKLAAIPLYKNDKMLVNVTENAFNFYIEEADTKVPGMVDFLVINKDFSRIQQALEKTPERKRTKKQVDAFNDKVKEINKMVKEYNQANAYLNTKRDQIIQELNSANERFLSKHIPAE